MTQVFEPFVIETPPPDPVWQGRINENCPVVIDLGSYRTKAGWASEPAPFLDFRSMVGRTKVDGELRDIVGNDIEHIYVPSKSPFIMDVPYHFGSIEAITDHVFGHLGLSGQNSVPHPVLITEPVCNPRHVRTCMTELMFECYNVPKLTYGIDALFSYWYHNRDNIDQLLSSSGLILRSGYKTTHVLSVIDGVLSPQIFRINVGGHHCTTLLQQVLHLSYPHHNSTISYNVAEQLKEKYAYVACDYSSELKLWQEILQGKQKDNISEKSESENKKDLPTLTLVEFPNSMSKSPGQAHPPPQAPPQAPPQTHTSVVPPTFVPTPTSTSTGHPTGTTTVPNPPSAGSSGPISHGVGNLEKRDQVREERIMRMRQMVQKRNEQKVKEKQDIVGYIEQLLHIKEENPSLYDSTLEKEGHTEKELNQELQKARKYLNEKQEKKDSQSKQQDLDYSLVNDDQLDQKQKKEKKKQNFLKTMAVAREIKKKEKEAQEIKHKGEEEKLEEDIKADPAKWLTKIQQQRTELQHRIEQKRKLSVSRLHGRQTVQSIARLKALTEVDADHEIEDWNIYRMLSGDITEGKEEEKLHKLDALLQRYFPQQTQISNLDNKYRNFLKPVQLQQHQLCLSSIKSRVGEVIYSPYPIIGVYQMGLMETIQLVLNEHRTHANQLVANTFATGGNFGYRGVKERLERELVEMMPMDTNINVSVASDPVRDTWRGAANFANSQYFKKFAFTKKQYHEFGLDYLMENRKHFALFHQ